METADGIYECKARGIFRKEKIKPLTGDRVRITVSENAENTIDEILERKNFLVRPPLANLDTLFIVSSVTDPQINTLVIDRLIATAEIKGIEPVIVLTKIDLAGDCEIYSDIYMRAGFTVILCNNTDGDGSDEAAALLKGKISAFTGNTGVGKTSLLNCIDSSLKLDTGETSKKLGRGRHTTRQCELFRAAGGYIADTPGFSAVDFEKGEKILKEELAYCFREFRPFIDKCKFQNNCSHINDKGCAVRAAVDSKAVSRQRYESYKIMYNEVKDIKEWQLK